MVYDTWFSLSLLFCCAIAASGCREVYNLKYNILHKGILCSAQTEDISNFEKKVSLFRKNNVIGIYAVNKAIGYVCYWKEVESGLVDLMTLSGGTFHMTGNSLNLMYFKSNAAENCGYCNNAHMICEVAEPLAQSNLNLYCIV